MRCTSHAATAIHNEMVWPPELAARKPPILTSSTLLYI